MVDSSEKHCLVKELDLTLQPRVAPRYKTWLPLATQQLRLRSLIQIIGHNLQTVDSNETCWFYYTFHRSTMSSPIYTSEPVDNVSPKWDIIEEMAIQETGYSASIEIIIRVWRRTIKDDPKSDILLFTWGISLNGLAFIGPKVPNNLGTILQEHSLIFHLHGGFFAPTFCLKNPPESKRYLSLNISSLDIRDSYSVSKLSILRREMQVLKQQSDSVKILRDKIASGESLLTPKFPQTSLDRLLQPKKVNREKKVEISKIRRDLEIAKFRAKLLEHERIRKLSEIRSLNQCHTDLLEKNQDYGSALMDRYRLLNREIEKLNDHRQSQIQSREIFIQMTEQLTHRQKQLISELTYIYPITCISKEPEEKFSINNVYLPDSEKLDSSNDTQIAIALGFVVHSTQMIANFLNVPTRYPMIHYGSRSKIIDHMNKNLPASERQFPLFARSNDKLQFHYAVYLLNKNIAQLRWYCGLPTSDLRATLPNLSGLICLRPNYTLDSMRRTFSGSSLDIDQSMNKNNFSSILPIKKSLLDKYCKTSVSISQFKGIKTVLGSSLDQGLNRPVHQLDILSNNSKRICKSQGSAIDDSTVTFLPVNIPNETENENIFVKKIELNQSANENEEKSDLVEHNIEIILPMSVSKEKCVSDIFESPVYSRQRSSNSISSCEMALSSSLKDGDDSSSGNGFCKNDDLSQCVSDEQNNENLMTKSVISKISEKKCDIVDKDTVYQEEVCVLLKNNSKSSLEKETDLKLNLNESPINYEDAGTVERQDQTMDCESSNQEEIPKEFLYETGCDLLSKTEVTSTVNSVQTTSDFTSKTYMDSIRRSSENVFARTEALANKSKSFKVMRPRL